MNRPGIANINCQRLIFEPGDRIIVRHQGQLDVDQQRKLTKSIQQWAGCEVRVLIIDTTRMDIEIEKLPIIGATE